MVPLRPKVARPAPVPKVIPRVPQRTPVTQQTVVVPTRAPSIINRVEPKKYLGAGHASRHIPEVVPRYVVIQDPTTIFGMVGRCGGGYSTVWQDWSEEGRAKRELIMTEFEEGINKINGHYTNLEKSIRQKGMLSPIVITCGLPLRRKPHHLPPEMLQWPVDRLLLAEGMVGGSRLYIAQKLKLPVTCIVNDRTGRFSHCPQITSIDQANSYFVGEPPTNFVLNKTEGLGERGKQKVVSDHVDPAFYDDAAMAKIRGPMWLDIMAKYGYEIELSPHVRKLIYGN